MASLKDFTFSAPAHAVSQGCNSLGGRCYLPSSAYSGAYNSMKTFFKLN